MCQQNWPNFKCTRQFHFNSPPPKKNVGGSTHLTHDQTGCCTLFSLEVFQSLLQQVLLVLQVAIFLLHIVQQPTQFDNLVRQLVDSSPACRQDTSCVGVVVRVRVSASGGTTGIRREYLLPIAVAARQRCQIDPLGLRPIAPSLT